MAFHHSKRILCVLLNDFSIMIFEFFLGVWIQITISPEHKIHLMPSVAFRDSIKSLISILKRVHLLTALRGRPVCKLKYSRSQKMYAPRKKRKTIMKLGTKLIWQEFCKWLKFWRNETSLSELCSHKMLSWNILKAWMLAP